MKLTRPRSRASEQPWLLPEVAENPWLTHKISQRRTQIIKDGAKLATLELCAGAGGQALGFELAGIDHAALIELDAAACDTLRLNRPQWRVVQGDLNGFDAREFKGVDLVSGGFHPPFAQEIAGARQVSFTSRIARRVS